jgi:hypothetical protein
MRKESPIACQSHYLLRNDATEMLLENDVNSSLIGQSPIFLCGYFRNKIASNAGFYLLFRKYPTLAYRAQLNFAAVKIIYDISTNTSSYIQHRYYTNIIFNVAQSSFRVLLCGTLPTLLKDFV